MVLLVHDSSQPMPYTGISIGAGATVSLQSQSLKSRLDCWGIQVSPWPCTSDRHPLFARDKSKLNRGIPRGEGGGQNSRQLMLPDRRVPHAQIFFLAPRVLIQSNEIKTIKSRIISMRGRPAPFQRRDLFSGAPGGGQKVYRSRARTGGRATRIFSGNSRIFFLRGATTLRKLPRNSGWGGR